MNKDFSNKETVIESLHRARMEQWIGDFEEAEKIYDAILDSDDNIVNYLKPSIEDKKKKLIMDNGFYKQKKGRFNDFEVSHYKDQILIDSSFQEVKFGSQKYSPPLMQKREISVNNPVESVWKYSVIASSRAGEMIRFEIRGYPQKNRKPELRNISKQISEHNIRAIIFTPLEQQLPDSVCMDVLLGDEQLTYYIEIDSWGSIRGEAIIPDEKVTVFLQDQNEFLSNLEKAIWLE